MALSMCCGRVLLRRITYNGLSCRKNGYLILIPEIGEDMSPDKNPLMQQNGLPQFNNITIENCMAAISKQTLDFESDINRLEKKITDKQVKNIFTDIFEEIEKLETPLNMTWGLAKTLYLGNSTLMPTKSYLAIHNRARRARSGKFNSKIIYEAAVEAVTKNEDISEEQRRVLDKYILEGKLNGVNLDGAGKETLQAYLTQLGQEKEKFRIKNDMSTRKFVHRIYDKKVVEEFPTYLLQAMTTDSSMLTTGPWIVNLQPHICFPFLEYCPQRELRWNVWQAIVSRGSAYREKDFETVGHLEEIRILRRCQANLLGYKSFADMSMETKMAGSVDNVKNMLENLLDTAKLAQQQELENLLDFAKSKDFKYDQLELWDVPYWKRKQQVSLFNYNEQEIQEYFPLSNVLNGLFDLCEHLFDIRFKEQSNASTWHKDVKFYDIFESHSEKPIAGFYLDPYARSSEKVRIHNSGWMVGIQSESRLTETKAISALIFNFDPPIGDKPSLLHFKDVKMLFNRFGHALQHLLSRTTYSEISGLSNIEWDAVEVSGYMLQHWLCNKSTIDRISSHYQSGDKLPSQAFESLMSVNTHMSGLDLCRELYLSALDLELHATKTYWLDLVKKLWPHYRCFPLHKQDAHPCSFTQIVVDEWGAAYYSHIWSRMLAADAYSAFHEAGNDEKCIKETGKRYRNTFLALGGSCKAGKVFRQFRGRDPSPKALLRSLGLKKIAKTEEVCLT